MPLLLGVMIWRQWPITAFWVIRTLVGINMIVTGTTRLALSTALRRVRRIVAKAA